MKVLYKQIFFFRFKIWYTMLVKVDQEGDMEEELRKARLPAHVGEARLLPLDCHLLSPHQARLNTRLDHQRQQAEQDVAVGKDVDITRFRGLELRPWMEDDFDLYAIIDCQKEAVPALLADSDHHLLSGSSTLGVKVLGHVITMICLQLQIS